MGQRARLAIIRTTRQPLAISAEPTVGLSILQRLKAKEKLAVADCISKYGSLIWAFSSRLTRSSKEAETLSQEIFNDIWKYSEQNDLKARKEESMIIRNIAFRRLLKHKWESIRRP